MGRKIGVPFNSIFSWLIKKRIHQIELFKQYPIYVQFDVFEQLITTAKDTEFGKQHKFKFIHSYKEFIELDPKKITDEVKQKGIFRFLKL